jgi:type IV pilus assembly protein PilV
MKQPISTRQHGSALLEALIAILIFSMGILALMGLQAASIKNSSDAKYRADAAYLANQIIGQVWVDRTNIANYAHRTGGAACAPTGANSGNANVTAWLAQTADLLPGADSTKQQIVIGAVTATNAYPVTVTVCWQGPQDASSHNFVARAEINT